MTDRACGARSAVAVNARAPRLAALGRRTLQTCAFVALGTLAACNSPADGTATEAAATQAEQTPQRLETDTVIIRTRANDRHLFTVEVADEFSEQRMGLMFRTEMGPDEGMIFLYQQPRELGIWMKNTLISLDIVFIDALGRIINIRENAVPGDLTSMRSARPGLAVIELNGGRTAQLGIAPGDIVLHCHFGNWPCAKPDGNGADASGR